MFRERIANALRLYTFENIYLIPRKASIEPNEIDLTTKFSKNIVLNIPIASSPMDMVTELDMAIAIALHGGIGVVHRNMSIDQQVEIVSRVKSYPPIKLRNAFVKPNDMCSRVMDYMVSEGIRDLPVVDDLGYVRGYVRLWKLKEICRKGNEVVNTIIDSGTIYNITEIEKARRSIIRGEFDAIAIVSKEGFYVGTLLLRDAIEEITPVLDKDGRLLVAAAISPFDIDRAKKLDKYVDALVSDVAHFHNINILDSARKLVKEISADFIAGNIGTYEAAIDVIHSVERVDGFRVGIAGGSICITADVAGVYAPTLWAVASVRDAIEDLKLSIPIVADGGIRTSGDAVKALAAGASSVMLGYVLAGTDEASAPLIAVGEKLYKPYRGMASRGAMTKRYAVDRYSRTVKRAPEGVEGLVPYKGPLSKIIKEFVEGIRAGLGYAGARNIEELWRVALFGIAPRKETIQNLF